MGRNSVTAMSTLEIRTCANKLRKLLGYELKCAIYPSILFDQLSIYFANQGLSFNYQILPDDDKLFGLFDEAMTDMQTGTIYIKESIMKQACDMSNRRSIFTLMHELGHYLLHYVQSDVKFKRVSSSTVVPAYCDPEWQADTFASELLMPFDAVKNMDSEEIRKTFHVSKTAAEVRYRKVQKESWANTKSIFSK